MANPDARYDYNAFRKAAGPLMPKLLTDRWATRHRIVSDGPRRRYNYWLTDLGRRELQAVLDDRAVPPDLHEITVDHDGRCFFFWCRAHEVTRARPYARLLEAVDAADAHRLDAE